MHTEPVVTFSISVQSSALCLVRGAWREESAFLLGGWVDEPTFVGSTSSWSRYESACKILTNLVDGIMRGVILPFYVYRCEVHFRVLWADFDLDSKFVFHGLDVLAFDAYHPACGSERNLQGDFGCFRLRSHWCLACWRVSFYGVCRTACRADRGILVRVCWRSRWCKVGWYMSCFGGG